MSYFPDKTRLHWLLLLVVVARVVQSFQQPATTRLFVSTSTNHYQSAPLLSRKLISPHFSELHTPSQLLTRAWFQTPIPSPNGKFLSLSRLFGKNDKGGSGGGGKGGGSSTSNSGASFDYKEIKRQFEEKLIKCLENIQQQFNAVRGSGGMSPTLFDRVLVGGTTGNGAKKIPLNQLARVTTTSTNGQQVLIVDPFEKSNIAAIEIAISSSDLAASLACSPTNDGQVVRLLIPPMTEERRKELVKQVKVMSEDGKVAMRNVRRDSVEKVKQGEKDKTIGKDESKTYQVSCMHYFRVLNIIVIYALG